jgi:hypothetical protein
MNTEPDPIDAHRQLFDETARQVLAATLDFARKVGPRLTTLDVARIYLGAATLVAGQTLAPAGVAGMLRDLADSIDRPSRATLN